MSDESFDGIQLRVNSTDPSDWPNQWPRLSCRQANQMALEHSDLRLDATREILFQGNGQIRSSGDIHLLAGGSAPEQLRVFTTGNVGIGTTTPPTTKLEVAGTVKATSFQGDGSTLDGVVKKAGDTITGALTINNALTVSGQVGIGTTAPPTAKLEVAGIVKASSFQGDGSTLDGVVKKAGDTITGALTINNALTVNGNVGIGTTNPNYKLEVAGDIKASSIYSKPKVFSFKVEGDFDKFYPAVFYDDNWGDGPTELEINRPNVHTDSQWRGALNSRFTFHSSSWGHGADFCKAEIYYSQIQFIAGYQNYFYGTRFIVWLRGGGTTYYWRSKVTITLEDYSAKEKVVELSKELTKTYPQTAVTYPVKTNIDSYV